MTGAALLAAIMLATAVTVSAQHGLPRASKPIPPPSIGLPLPPIGLPLAPIGLPLPRIGLAPLQSGGSSLHDAPNANRVEPARRHDRGGFGRHNGPAIFYVVPPYGWWDFYAPGAVIPPPPPERKPSRGYLRVELRSMMDAQVYIDGYYVGLLSEFPGGWPLDAGPHLLELRADGHQPAAIDVQVFEGRVTTYRGSLTETAPPPTPEPPPRIELHAPMGPVYFIPGCYLGNVAPQELALPAGCDPAAAVRMDR